ncbi:hypothetical protein CCR75_004430 [Bremia lactucae]|uniref:Jacalin-type lectin domain-containing protein n=1 Tax=Bremia lactucae TaxID=4779 RepID=A0A976IIF2_BRELC|nr:hypothetical protein CCR75_004430 [Bremia lactucae]
MKLQFQVFSTIALVASGGTFEFLDNLDQLESSSTGETSRDASYICQQYSFEETVNTSKVFGGLGGEEFTDVKQVRYGVPLNKVILYSGERLDGISLIAEPVSDPFSLLHHGGKGGREQIFNLETGEFINKFTVQTGRKDGGDRIRYIKLDTNRNRSFEGGTRAKDDFGLHQVDAPPGFMMTGCHGRAKDEIDALGAVFVKVSDHICKSSKKT